MPSVSVTPNLSAPFAKTAPPEARAPPPASDFRVNTSPIFSRLSRFIVRAPARALLGLIWLYQRTLSPALPVVLGPHCGCRFSPTCSHYAAEAVRTHGALFGSLLTLRRLVKCTPLHPGGFDPVPPSAGIRRTGLARRGLVCRRTNLPTGA